MERTKKMNIKFMIAFIETEVNEPLDSLKLKKDIAALTRLNSNPEGFSDFVDSDILECYPGIDLRFIHKTIFSTTFRIDYGYGIKKMLLMELYSELDSIFN